MLALRHFLLGSLLFLWTIKSYAQSSRHQLDFSQDVHRGFWHQELVLDSNQQSFVIHFPLQAYIDKGSFLNAQLREFQDPDLHFAKEDELAFFKIDSLLLNGQQISWELSSEFHELNVRDAASLKMYYSFRMPVASFTGNGRSDEQIQFINLLPRVFRNWSEAHPVSYFYDINPCLEEFEVSVLPPSGLKAVSNLPSAPDSSSWLRFNGKAEQFQLWLAPQWHRYTLKGGHTLIIPEPDESFKLNFELALDECAQYFKGEINRDLGQDKQYIVTDYKKGEFQSAQLISLARPKSWEDLRFELILAQAESFFRYELLTNGWQDPWLARGLPYFYKYNFIESRYPQKRWVPFQSPILNGLFGFDDYDYGYKNRFLFLFLQRQGLDQAAGSPVDSLSRLNYEAAIKAKTYLMLSHLRAYVGAKDFKRSILRMTENTGGKLEPKDFSYALSYYSNQDVDWFFDSALRSANTYDYQLQDIDYCPTVSTATVSNSGQLALPFSLTGFVDGEPVITEWFDGHAKDRTVQMYHADYDKVVLNAHLRHAEYRQKNNTVYNRFLFPRAEPLQFQLYNSFEAAEATQIFYVPSLYYNAYDRFLIGLNLSNRSILVQKPFEWLAVPEYSTGTGKLTGTASIAYNFILPKQNYFRQIKLGLYTRYNHYDRDLAYYRVSPSISFFLRKKYPRSPYIRTFRIRGVILNREQDALGNSELDIREQASYSVLNINYRQEHTSLLKPTIFRTHLEISQNFGKLFTEYDQRWMLPNKKWLIARGFAGAFLYNSIDDSQGLNDLYGFGLSGTPDYLFDYYLIGRSDQSGIWSRQFFTTDGGFKSETGVYANQFMLSGNLSLPFIGPLGAFGDIATADGSLYWDYGIRLAFLTDFVEVYLPLQNQDRVFFQEPNYLSNLRFVLDLKLGSIINRLRRGYY